MARFGAEKTSGSRNAVISVLLFLAILFLVLSMVSSWSEDALDRQQENLTRALVQGAVRCYAVEGAYPESLEQLLEKYSITYDTSRFFIDYRTEGQNMMPDISVIRK
jgi:hypothetical protein